LKPAGVTASLEPRFLETPRSTRVSLDALDFYWWQELDMQNATRPPNGNGSTFDETNTGSNP
jgi:hypothetical protein